MKVFLGKQSKRKGEIETKKFENGRGKYEIKLLNNLYNISSSMLTYQKYSSFVDFLPRVTLNI